MLNKSTSDCYILDVARLHCMVNGLMNEKYLYSYRHSVKEIMFQLRERERNEKKDTISLERNINYWIYFLVNSIFHMYNSILIHFQTFHLCTIDDHTVFVVIIIRNKQNFHIFVDT